MDIVLSAVQNIIGAENDIENIIVQFWMWYVSGNHKRDLSKKEEGEKYAENFLNDLAKEIAGVE